MTHKPAPAERTATTQHCPWCSTSVLPIPATDTKPAGAYCPRCPWHSSAPVIVPPRKPRKPENMRPPIRATGHLQQRQRERNRWLDTRPVTYTHRPRDLTPPDESPWSWSNWTTTDRVLVAAAVAFIVAALVIKHWPR